MADKYPTLKISREGPALSLLVVRWGCPSCHKANVAEVGGKEKFIAFCESCKQASFALVAGHEDDWSWER